MSRDRDLDRLIALLEEHELIPDYESDRAETWGHAQLYEKVRQTPFFPMSVDEIRELLERRPMPFG